VKGTEAEILKLIFRSSYYYVFEAAFVVALFVLFLLLFCLAWKEFFLFLSLARILASRYAEESTALPQSQESRVDLKEVA